MNRNLSWYWMKMEPGVCPGRRSKVRRWASHLRCAVVFGGVARALIILKTDGRRGQKAPTNHHHHQHPFLHPHTHANSAKNAPRQRPRLLRAREHHLEARGVPVAVVHHYHVGLVEHAPGPREGRMPLRVAPDVVAVGEDCARAYMRVCVFAM